MGPMDPRSPASCGVEAPPSSAPHSPCERQCTLEDDDGLMQLSAAAEAAQPMAASVTTSITSSQGANNDMTPTVTTNGATERPPTDTTDVPSKRVVQLVTKTKMTSTTPTGPDVGLPPGWRRVIHESGLPCFVHEDLHVVTWTRPYGLDAIGTDFETVAKTHVPPLSIFSRRDVGPRHAQLVARRRPSEEDMLLRPKAPPQPSSDPREGSISQKKRKADQSVVPAAPSVYVRRLGISFPIVEVNGKPVESPEGRSVHAFLRDFAMAMWKAVPQYNYSRLSDFPVACSVRINDKEYPTIPGPNKPIAKEAAAEAVLEQHIPGYWMELKKQGRVGKYPIAPPSHQSPPAVQIKEERKASVDEKEPTMTLDEFKTLLIGDPRVLQACMDLSIKTPAQVVQEYQNRHRGISVNYNTIPHEVDGQKLFKTIVTAGSTAAEGTASTKKVAKQYAAQSLLVMLHERAVKYYYEVADLYSRGNNHSDLVTQLPLTVQTDPGSTRLSPSKKPRRSSPLHVQAPVSTYGPSGGVYTRPSGRGWDGGAYGGAYDHGPSTTWQQRPDPNYAKKNERIVEYYTPNSNGGYSGFYGGGTDEWGYSRPAPPPPSYTVYTPTPYGPPPTTARPPLSAPYAPPPSHARGPLPGYPYGAPPYARPKF